jgi:hypothetical protein
VLRIDYEQAWRIISSWNDQQSRAVGLAALRSSPRRPYVVIAMLRICAMLSAFADVSEIFANQVSKTSYAQMEEGILHITDQILQALKPDARMTASLDDLVDTFAGQEPPATEAIQPATTQAVEPVKQADILQGTGKTLRMDEAPIFARVRVKKLGSLDTHPEAPELIGETVITWTEMERSKNIFAEVQVRGILRPENEVAWTIGELWGISGDAEVEIIDPPLYAGQPEDLIPLAEPVKPPANTGSREGWPPLIWRSMPLYRALVPLDDCLNCVETILCALSVAPPTFDVEPWLLAGLKARHAELLREGDLYSPKEYRWRYKPGPRKKFWHT